MDKKILIIGNSASTYALAKKLSEKHEVFVAPGNDTIKEFADCVDIRETSATELLDFALENSIDMTIPISEATLKTDIVELFNKNNLSIFAPSINASKLITDKAYMKKLLYKLRIPTPKFGIFEKQNMTIDYIKNLKNPYLIKTNDKSSATIFTNASMSKNIVESLFVEKNQKLIIEDYIWGSPFALYVITDGYKALPLNSSIIHKYSLEGDGGQLTTGMGACVPNYKLSIDNEFFILNNVVYPIIEFLERENNPYIGILGINGLITEDGRIQIVSFDNFMQDCDTAAILANLDMDFYQLAEACTIGSFSDEVESIPTSQLSSTSIVLTCKNKDNKNNVIEGLDNLDENIVKTFYPTVQKNRYLEYEVQNGPALVLTSIARTSASSTKKVYQETQNINFSGIFYRKDICKTINADF